MHLKSLRLCHFRNYEEAYLEFSPHINIFLGANAQGKTNLLEAIYLLIFGSSFRTKRLQELIQIGKNGFYIEANFEKFGIDQTLKIQYGIKEKRFFYNATEHESLRQLLGILHAVFLTPKDRELIEGAPDIRREYIDQLLVQEDPLYLYHLQRYFRAMKQRNVMLKSKNILGIECWEYEMARSSSYITSKRHIALNDILSRSKELQKALCNDDFHLVFDAPLDKLEAYYFECFRKDRPKELLIGYTINGPHRDDFGVYLNGLAARQFESEGQKSTAATTLRFASWHRLKEETNLIPLLCIDDMGTSLDSLRKQDLIRHLDLFGQVFITSADKKDLFSSTGQGNIFCIEAGAVTVLAK
jgi:DNA replication and repair protein RecF